MGKGVGGGAFYVCRFLLGLSRDIVTADSDLYLVS